MWKRLYLESFYCNCENEKHLASIMDNSAIICDETIDVKERNFNEKKYNF